MDLSRYVSSIEGKIKAEDRMAELKKNGGDSLEFVLMDFGDYYPNALRELTSLKHLSIIHCHTWQGQPAWLADLPCLETLNLSSGGGVEELLPHIHKLKRLRKLNIGYNGIKHIGDNFAELENLEELCLDACFFTKFPEVVGRLPKLHTLEIEYSLCHLEDIFTVLANAPQLRKLKLSPGWWEADKAPIEKIVPDAIGKLSQLEELVLKCNASEIADSIADMVSLKRLSLCMPKLERLPSRLFERGQLEFLDIENCKFLNVPDDDLRKLSNLKGLNLLMSPIGGLPNLSQQQLEQVEELHLQGPLPDLSYCKNLRVLQYCTSKPERGTSSVWSEDDPETSFPMFSLPHLEKLQLHGGKYTDISFVENSPNLREIDLQCDVTCLPIELSNLKKLETLELYNTVSLRALPDSITGLASLKRLAISDANLDYIPYDLTSLRNLKEIDIDFADEAQLAAKIIAPLYTIPNLEELTLDAVPENFPNGISNLKNLRRLSLSSHRENTEGIHFPQDMGQLENLVSLYIYHPNDPDEDISLPISLPDLSGLNNLVSCSVSFYKVHSSLFSLPKLKYLNLGGQDFEELPAAICNLPNLAVLDFDNCHHLKKIPLRLVQQGPLRHIGFTWCNLDNLPEGLESPGVLEQVIWDNTHRPYEEIRKRINPALDPIFFAS